MTNIQFLKDRIIIDGHADTKEQCETITLLCDNLAKSKDFKTVRYESGYAEFVKVGQTNKLKFVSIEATVYMVWDSGVVSVVGPDNHEFTTSGSSYTSSQLYDPSASNYNVTVNLKAGYVIDTVVGSSEGTSNIPVSSVTNNSFVLDSNDVFMYGGSCTYTITTKQSGSSTTKQQIDISTLSGWANLSNGAHSITVKAKASSYTDSAASNAVTVTKGTTPLITFGIEGGNYSAEEGMTWGEWVASSYNTANFVIANTNQIQDSSTGKYVAVADERVTTDEAIIANKSYMLSSAVE